MAASATYGALPASDHSAQLRKAVIASTIGTAIEWYDFFLYGTAAGLVFAKLYFPNADPLIGTLTAFAIYSVGFVARPVGAAIFGHYGDRIGRKSTLIATLMLMGIATFLVAFVPSYEFDRHLGGGDPGGAALHPGYRRRRRVGWLGADVHGVVAHPRLARLRRVLATVRRALRPLPRQPRLPLLQRHLRRPVRGPGAGASRSSLSIILVGVGLYIRLGILETPIFTKLVAHKKIERTPILEVFKRQPKEIFVSAFVRMAEQAPFYIFTAFIFGYGTTVLKCRATISC